MKRKSGFEEYLRSIGLEKPLMERAELALAFFQRCGYVVDDIFVNDYIAEDGSRRYDALDLFTAEAVLTAFAFATESSYSIAPIVCGFSYVRLTMLEYDCEKATKSSRLTVDVTLTNDVTGNYRATGENCDHLWALTRKYILPRVTK